MILEFLGLKENKFPEDVWVDAAKNCKDVEQFNNLILTLQVYSFFEIIFDIVFIAFIFVISFLLIYSFFKIKDFMINPIKNN